MARCERCEGNGAAILSGFTTIGKWEEWPLPCPECQGSGIVSCCDTSGAQYMKPEDYWADVEKAEADYGN